MFLGSLLIVAQRDVDLLDLDLPLLVLPLPQQRCLQSEEVLLPHDAVVGEVQLEPKSLDAWSSYLRYLLYFLPDYLHLLPPFLQGPLQLRHRDPLEPRQAVLRVARQLEDGDPGLVAADDVVDPDLSVTDLRKLYQD